MASISRIFAPAYLQRATRLLPYALTHKGAETALELVMKEVGFAVPLLFTYLYQAGKTDRTGEGNMGSKFLTAMAEAAATYGIVMHTKGFFPLLALGWTAYQLGTSSTKLDKIKSVLKAAVLFPLGYLGVHLGLSYSDGMVYRDAKKMQGEIDRYLKNYLKTTPTNPLGKELHPLFKELRKQSSELITLFEKQEPNVIKMRELTNAFETAQSTLFNKVSSFTKTQLDSLSRLPKLVLLGEKGQQGIMSEIRTAQTYKLVRMLNPLFGYLLFTTAIGVPILMFLNKLVMPKGTPPQSLDSWSDIAPLWLNDLLKLKPSGGGHGEFPIPNYADGPAMIREFNGGGAGH